MTLEMTPESDCPVSLRRRLVFSASFRNDPPSGVADVEFLDDRWR